MPIPRSVKGAVVHHVLFPPSKRERQDEPVSHEAQPAEPQEVAPWQVITFAGLIVLMLVILLSNHYYHRRKKDV